VKRLCAFIQLETTEQQYIYRDATSETPVCLHTTRNYRATVNTQKDKQNKYDKVEQQAVKNPLFPETEY